MTGRHDIWPVTQAPPAMRADLAEQFDMLQNEVGALRYRYDEYVTLFDPSPERIKLLNATAPVFFKMLFDTLWGDMLMHLTRVTGPVRHRTRTEVFDNLTLRRLPELVHEEFKAEVETYVENARTASEFAQPGRNKVYAHRDLAVALDQHSLGVTLGSRTEMAKAIAATEAALDVVARLYGANRGSALQHFGFGIARDLLQTLEAGVKAQPGHAAKIIR